LFNAKSATEELDKIFEKLSETMKKTEEGTFELTEEFKALARESKEAARIQIRVSQLDAIDAAKIAVGELREELGSLSGFSNDFNIASDDLGQLIRLLNKPINNSAALVEAKDLITNVTLANKEASPELVRFAQSVNNAWLQLKQAEDSAKWLEGLPDDLEGVGSATDRYRKQLESMVEALEMEAATLGYTDKERALYVATLKGATKEQLLAISASYELIDAHKKEEQAVKDLATANKKKVSDAKRLSAENDREISNIVRLDEARQRATERLEEQLRTEEEKILASYEHRREQILKLEKDPVKQQVLLERNDDKFATDVLGRFDKGPDTFAEKEAAIIEEFERTRQLILSNQSITEEMRTQLELDAANARNEQLAALEAQKNQMMLSNASALFDGLAGLAEAFGGEQSDAYRVLFAVSKAFSVAQAIMSIQTGLAKAQELGFPANIPAMAQIAATGASILSTIQSATFAGAAHGGLDNVPSESTFLLQKGERVLSPNQNRDLTSFLSRQSGPSNSGQPQAQRQESARQTPQAQNEPNQPIIVFDPNMALDALATPKGGRVLLQEIKSNREQFRRILGVA
jgi:hypothetical protein